MKVIICAALALLAVSCAQAQPLVITDVSAKVQQSLLNAHLFAADVQCPGIEGQPTTAGMTFDCSFDGGLPARSQLRVALINDRGEFTWYLRAPD